MNCFIDHEPQGGEDLSFHVGLVLQVIKCSHGKQGDKCHQNHQDYNVSAEYSISILGFDPILVFLTVKNLQQVLFQAGFYFIYHTVV